MFEIGSFGWLVHASPRGHASRRIPMQLMQIEPLVVPKTVLSGCASELIETRVLEVVCALTEPTDDSSLGTQLDRYMEAKPLPAPPPRTASQSSSAASLAHGALMRRQGRPRATQAGRVERRTPFERRTLEPA